MERIFAILLDYGVPALVFVLVLAVVWGAFWLGRRSNARGSAAIEAGRRASGDLGRAPATQAPPAPDYPFRDVAWTPSADLPRPDSLWPAAPVHDWTVRRALQWWEETQRRDACEDGGQFFRRLREAASDGHATVWGRQGAGGLSVDDYDLRPLEEIPAGHWKHHDFDSARYIYALTDEMARQASTPEHGPVATRYFDLMVASAEIRALWPEVVGAA